MGVLANDLKILINKFEEENREKVSKDQWRLNYHIMPPIGWLNDPNGLCELNGEYHVFYQYSPCEANGGLKYWGHYVSKDLVNWKEEEVSLYPDSPYDCHGVYSGSAFVENNKMYLYYTGNVKHKGNHDYIMTGREQNTILVTSEDGINFSHKELIFRNSDYPQNMSTHVRDPKVWKEDNTYYMVLGARDDKSEGCVLLYTSKDNKNWQYTNEIRDEKPLGYMWECPDFFKLGGKQVLMISPQGVEPQGYKFNNVYQTGYMMVNGDITTDNYKLTSFDEIDRGFDFYAPQSFEDSKGRRIFVGWMGVPDIPYTNPTVEKGWQHALTMPRELRLINNKVYQLPLEEMMNLRGDKKTFNIANSISINAEDRSFELILNLHSNNKQVNIKLRKDVVLNYSNKVFTLSLGESGYGRDTRSVEIDTLESLRIFSDNSSLEIFLNNGEEVFTTRVYDEENHTNIEINGENISGELYTLNKYIYK